MKIVENTSDSEDVKDMKKLMNNTLGNISVKSLQNYLEELRKLEENINLVE